MLKIAHDHLMMAYTGRNMLSIKQLKASVCVTAAPYFCIWVQAGSSYLNPVDFVCVNEAYFREKLSCKLMLYSLTLRAPCPTIDLFAQEENVIT
jgi:hypothetical protein